MEEKYGKVYRDYFSVQTTNWAVSYPDEDIPGILKNPFLRDVSDEYFGRNVAVVPLYDSAGDARIPQGRKVDGGRRSFYLYEES